MAGRIGRVKNSITTYITKSYEGKEVGIPNKIWQYEQITLVGL